MKYPAIEPPIHGMQSGVNAGALPAVLARDGIGEGLLRIATWSTSARRGSYGSYARRFGLRTEAVGVILVRVCTISSCSRGMKPGIIAVPPTTKMVEINSFLRSTGVWPTISVRLNVNGSAYLE